MRDSLSIQSDSSDYVDATVAPEQPVASQRVRELPPPPKTIEAPPESPLIDTDETTTAGWRRFFPRRLPTSFMVSFLFHFLLLLGLALWVQSTLSSGSREGELTAWFELSEPLESSPETAHVLMPEAMHTDISAAGFNTDVRLPVLLAESLAQQPGPAHTQFGALDMEVLGLLQRKATTVGGGLEGRSGEARARLAKGGGGTHQSEKAVEWGLNWLAAHQLDDGSWRFDHNKSVCGGQCANAGTEPSTTGATAIVLMAFLGAGYTHTEGIHQETVKRGLYYLGGQALVTPKKGTDMREGTMYAHGLATIALCEAYAMTGDESLRGLAQGGIDFIVYAQDRNGGGWRYQPGEPGDTTVSGWQVMALKSGQMAKLSVPSPVIYDFLRFLESVQSRYGALYGYRDARGQQTTTAVGLLMRMYTGWKRRNSALRDGVGYISKWGPSDNDMYYNYYATQVMHHWGGDKWEKWNQHMREHLIATQAKQGHESGSWHFKDTHGDKGGRLYNTAMAVMTLEVYYRHMPLYKEESVKDTF